MEADMFSIKRKLVDSDGNVIGSEEIFRVGVEEDGTQVLHFKMPVPIEEGGTSARTVEGARANLGVPSIAKGGSYWGLGFPDGTNVGYMRTPSSGLIPRMEGGCREHVPRHERMAVLPVPCQGVLRHVEGQSHHGGQDSLQGACLGGIPKRQRH